VGDASPPPLDNLAPDAIAHRVLEPTMITMLLPNTIDLEPIRVEGVRTVTYDVAADVPAALRGAEVLVVWGNVPERLRAAAASMPNLRWVATLAAGPDAILGAGFDDATVLTSGVSLHTGPVAEHALALLLAVARRLPELRDAQSVRHWSSHLGGIQPRFDRGAFRSLIGAHVVIWGFGHIGQRLASLLTALEARVTGVARSAGERGGVPVVAASDVAALLPSADALVMILPSLPSTRQALDAERLALLPPHAWLVNVGRGDTVDEAALIRALADGTLAGAALDVFETEPLPAGSPLWTMPNVLISPHAAGGRPMGAESLLTDNLERWLAGRPLRNVVERA
jgi:phosphoglycerate dehydrogenase-like enzyme